MIFVLDTTLNFLDFMVTTYDLWGAFSRNGCNVRCSKSSIVTTRMFSHFKARTSRVTTSPAPKSYSFLMVNERKHIVRTSTEVN